MRDGLREGQADGRGLESLMEGLLLGRRRPLLSLLSPLSSVLCPLSSVLCPLSSLLSPLSSVLSPLSSLLSPPSSLLSPLSSLLPDDFSKQGQGMLLLYTLKNSTCPEYIYPTSSGIMCLHIHARLSHLVAVGFYDGCVAVFDLKAEEGGAAQPVYRSTAKAGKHTNPVWQVRR